ncbi:MAG TPA: type IX secretion system protein PorQ [Bacteroidales bacterium]|nr:type IX secretion system protein PorQ [Bacteroidales bacterium]OQC60801.1 MAG: hypothetical protein BWX51_00847 [Bacteroidetes bacterium ADurb.Bin012]HNQ59629.1 type IX secretion system protein PorQ [Bacteroidales bacterium]HNU21379.1 type IX secretion system protein PorQ [Bacteroidales bacterium]HNV16775.1 type IX secretion system protein PorQ [Bacteroidales bacterium]
MRHRKNILVLSIILGLGNSFCQAQTGGTKTYEFLNLPTSARAAALGYNVLSISDNDISLVNTNPSLLNPEMHNNLVLSFVDYFADINYGYATYARSFSKTGNFAATLQFIDYGTFTSADPTGSIQGSFGANELALNLSWGRSLDSNFSIGASLKGIYSSFESYTSTGIAVDVAGSFILPEQFLSISLIARNIGLQLSTYSSTGSEDLPLEIDLAVSKRLEHVPLRFSIIATNLQKWDLTYTDPFLIETDPLTGEEKQKNGLSGFPDKLMRHFIFGAELQPVKALSLRLGYNYQRRQQLKLESKMGMVGFSWGIGLKISKFQLNFAHSIDHLAGAPNYISLSTNFGDFLK